MSLSTPRMVKDRTRPSFPKRAIITAGMPYGNKDLHFGHVGGVFVHADAFARFLRDRIGPENVIFVSGTDCYGSPIVEDYRNRVSRGEFTGTLQEFVESNHDRQLETLNAYAITPSVFAASAMEPFREIHRQLGAWIMEVSHRHGHLAKMSNPQFYDSEMGTFLNGRQVVGRCPIQGCQSEKAYADECSLGHQYEPKDLIDPKSTLTGKRPEMRDVVNWYLDVEKFRETLRSWLDRLMTEGAWREFAVRNLLEYFEPPIIHVKRDQMEQVEEFIHELPPHRREAGAAKSDKLIFDRLGDLEFAVEILAQHHIRYRTGKTLVPFRLTGNLDWGLPAPEIDGVTGLTFWVWPESLWAPISFTAAVLESRGQDRNAWRDWWCAKDAMVYQFIGEDNIYFYGLAEMALFLGLQGEQFTADPPEGQMQLPRIIANRHLLFLDKKASSSGAVKPPMARDLLNYYTADQLRAHFLSLGLGMRNISFRPKPLDPKATPASGDPVLKEGNLLSNGLNHAVRSCFYTAQKFYDSRVPSGDVSHEVIQQSETAIFDFEEAMAGQSFHVAMGVAGDFVRDINSRWTRAKPFRDECDPELRRQTLVDALHMVRVAITLMHPIAPQGTEKVREYLQVDESIWSWDRIFDPLVSFFAAPAEHRLKFLPPRVDFFEKHPSQIQADE